MIHIIIYFSNTHTKFFSKISFSRPENLVKMIKIKIFGMVYSFLIIKLTGQKSLWIIFDKCQNRTDQQEANWIIILTNYKKEVDWLAELLKNNSPFAAENCFLFTECLVLKDKRMKNRCSLHLKQI